MTVKIDTIDMSEGDGLVIQVKGSKEYCIAVHIDEKANLIVTGPINRYARTMLLRIDGWHEVKSVSSPKGKDWDCHTCGDEECESRHPLGALGVRKVPLDACPGWEPKTESSPKQQEHQKCSHCGANIHPAPTGELVCMACGWHPKFSPKER
jgi:hypothetical protein